MIHSPNPDFEGDDERLFEELFASKPPPALPAERPLDEVLASRSHVRHVARWGS